MMTDEERTPGITQKHKKKHLSFREKSIILETMLLETNTTLFNITFINDFMFKSSQCECISGSCLYLCPLNQLHFLHPYRVDMGWAEVALQPRKRASDQCFCSQEQKYY